MSRESTLAGGEAAAGGECRLGGGRPGPGRGSGLLGHGAGLRPPEVTARISLRLGLGRDNEIHGHKPLIL
jgi:hypothetical protein